MEQNQSLIVLDKEIVATTKVDQAVWILTQANKELGVILREHSVLCVSTDEEKVAAEQSIMAIRKARKSWDGLRKEWGQPLDVAKKTMDRVMRERDDQAEAIEKAALGLVQTYTEEQAAAERARQAEKQKAVDEANRLLREKQEADEAAAKAAGEVYQPTGVPELVAKTEEPKVMPKASGMSYRRYWLYRVEDLSLVPDAYTKRVIDADKIDAALKAGTYTTPGQLSTCDAQIPGIQIFHDDRPIVRQ